MQQLKLVLRRHADHDPAMVCRPALGYGLCEVLEPSEPIELDSSPLLSETYVMEQYTSEDARREWRRILNSVEHDGAHVTITRYGVPAAVVVPVEWHDEAAAALTAQKKPSRNWHDGWTDLGRDGDGNQILRYEPTGGLYHVLPVEEG